MTDPREPYPGAHEDGGESIEDQLPDDPALDADLLLISRYFADETSDAESEEVERRMAEDPVFLDHIEPVVQLQIMIKKHGYRYPGESPLRDLALARKAEQAKRAAPMQADVQGAAASAATPRAVHPEVPFAEPRRPAVPVWAEASTPAAVPESVPRSAARVDVYPGETWLDRVAATLFNRGTKILALAALGLIAVYISVSAAYLRWYNRMSQPIRDIQTQYTAGRALAQTVHADSVVDTDSIETRTVKLEGGSTAVLRPGSRFSYRVHGDAVTNTHHAALDGDAILTLTQPWMIDFARGVFVAEPGTYAVHSDTTGQLLLVTVGRGVATFRPFRGNTDSVMLHRDDHLRVTRDGLMLLTEKADGFPSLTEPAHRAPPQPLPPGE